MHFKDVSETLFPITKARLEKFIKSRQQWVIIDCEQQAEIEICRMSYELFSDEDILSYLTEDAFELDWSYHKTCYKRLCDVSKIRRAETKSNIQTTLPNGPNSMGKVAVNTKTVTASAGEKRKSSRLVDNQTQSESGCKRQRNVLPEMCIICQRASPWFKKDKVRYKSYNLFNL